MIEVTCSHHSMVISDAVLDTRPQALPKQTAAGRDFTVVCHVINYFPDI
jgi:hypothetical protein